MKKGCIDKNRFAELLIENKQKYYRITYCYVKNEHDAQDVIGDAACKGLRNLHTLREPAYFDTWMTRIIINAAIDHLRKSAKYISGENGLPEDLPVGECSLDLEDSLDVYTALDALNENHKTCVILRYFEDYTFDQISAILQEPVTTIKSRLYRSLAQMRKHLEGGE